VNTINNPLFDERKSMMIKYNGQVGIVASAESLLGCRHALPAGGVKVGVNHLDSFTQTNEFIFKAYACLTNH